MNSFDFDNKFIIRTIRRTQLIDRSNNRLFYRDVFTCRRKTNIFTEVHYLSFHDWFYAARTVRAISWNIFDSNSINVKMGHAAILMFTVVKLNIDCFYTILFTLLYVTVPICFTRDIIT